MIDYDSEEGKEKLLIHRFTTWCAPGSQRPWFTDPYVFHVNHKGLDSMDDLIRKIENLKDPYGRDGFFALKIDRRSKNYRSASIEFFEQANDSVISVENIVSTYEKLSRKEVSYKTIIKFIHWFNKSNDENKK